MRSGVGGREGHAALAAGALFAYICCVSEFGLAADTASVAIGAPIFALHLAV